MMNGLGDILGGLGYQMPLTMGDATAPLSQISGVPSLDSLSASLPGMSSPSPSPFSIISNALMQNKGQQSPLSPMQAYAPQQAPVDMTALQQLLGSIGLRRHY